MKEGGDNTEKLSASLPCFDKIIWTQSMQRLYFLVERCFKLREPVLLVGETGGGKTTVCQMLSYYLGSELRILNCHQYTETSDFLGGFYPVRDRSSISSEFDQICKTLISSKAVIHYPDGVIISSDINQASQTISGLSSVVSRYRQGLASHPDVSEEEIHCIERLVRNLEQLHKKWKTIFTWQDGPLVEAMRNGDMFLVDEISMADDSVLERLNSVLEPERKLALAEKGGNYLERITAHPNFFLLATMNPGGDYGKKELSPALRNRFTEIWVPSVYEMDELKSIAVERLSSPDVRGIADVLINFWEWFNHLGTGRMLTVRDLLAWVSFINVAERNLGAESSCLHGAFLVLLDGLSLGSYVSRNEAADLRGKCLSFLLDKLKHERMTGRLPVTMKCFNC